MDAYDYPLPEAAIAQAPVEPRDAARLLVATEADGADSAVAHHTVRLDEGRRSTPSWWPRPSRVDP